MKNVMTKKGNVKSIVSLFNLTMMQLKEKLNISFKQNIKKSLLSLSFFIIGFAVVTVICYFLIYFSKKMMIFDFSGAFPTNVLVFIFTIMMALSIISNTVSLIKTLYFSRDNFVLLTLPTTPEVVFLSKLLVHYIFELKRNIMFLIPLFIAYGINTKLPIYYYPWMIVIFLFVVMIPVLIGALLSIPSMYVYQALKKRKVLMYSLIVLGVVGLVVLAGYLISIIPPNINFKETWGTTYFQIRGFLTDFERGALPFKLLVELMVGKNLSTKVFTMNTLYIGLGFIGALVLLFTLCFLLSKPLFYKMASKPFEYSTNPNAKIKKERKLSPFLAVIKKEWLLALRDGTLTSLVIELLIVMPLSIALLNSLYNAMNTRFLGTQLTVCFNFFITLLFMLASNIRIASAYSKDGAASYLNKLQPSESSKLLFAKLTCNLVVGILGIAVVVVIYSLYNALKPVEYLMFFVSVFALFVGHLLGSAGFDIMNSQAEQFKTFSSQTNNPNETKSTVLAFVLSLIFAGFYMFIAMDSQKTAWIKIMCVCLFYLGLKAYLYFLRIKVYYSRGN